MTDISEYLTPMIPPPLIWQCLFHWSWLKKRIHLFNKYFLNAFCVPGTFFWCCQWGSEKTKSLFSWICFKSSELSAANTREKRHKKHDSWGDSWGDPFKMTQAVKEAAGPTVAGRWVRWRAIFHANHCWILEAHLNKLKKKMVGWYSLDLIKKGLLFK